MSRLSEIRTSYAAVTAELARIRSQSNPARKDEIDIWMRAVDCAFFLLAFGQFERVVTEAAGSLIKEKRRQGDPENRPWLVANKLDLRQRLVLLFGERSDEYRKLDKIYDDRNDIAHNGRLQGPVNLKEFLDFVVRLEDQIT